MKGKIGGKITYQVSVVMEKLKDIGSSKHAAKNAARENGAQSKHDIAKATNIYGYNTYKNYLSIAKELAKYVHTVHNVSSIENIKPEQVRSFLESKINDNSITTKGSLNTYCSAIEKFETALNGYRSGNSFDFSNAIKDIKQSSSLSNNHINRAFNNPQKVIENMTNDKCKVVADLQLQHGLRVDEAKHIKIDSQLNGNTLTIQGKGGIIQVKELTDNQVKNVKEYAENGVFSVDYKAYLNEVKQAAGAAGEEYTGTHAFRYNYAQAEHSKYIQNGMSELAANLLVSKQMGHHREDITRHYLK